MAFKQYVLALTGVVQRLSSVLSDPTVGGPGDIPLHLITFQGLKANTNDIFVGDNGAITSASHAFRVDATDTAPALVVGPFEAGPIKLSDFYVLGTNGETLVVGAVPF